MELAQPTPNVQSLWWPMLTSLLGDAQLSSPVRQTALETLLTFIVALPLPLHSLSSSDKDTPQKEEEEGKASMEQEWAIDEALSGLYYQVAQCLGALGEPLREPCWQQVGERDHEYGALKQILLVSVWVQLQRVPSSRLVALRSVCWTWPEEAPAALVSMWMSTALREEQEVAVQQRWYQDALDCALVMPHPRLVLRFLAALALAWAAPEVETLLDVRMVWARDLYPRLSARENLEWWLPILWPRLLVHLARGETSPDRYVASQRDWLRQQVHEPSSPLPPPVHSILSHASTAIHRVLPPRVSISFDE